MPPGGPSPGGPPPEVDWDSLDKRRFMLQGVGLFTGVTTLLYPLTVLKTRNMALADEGMLSAVRKLARTEGVRGLYRGYSTVIVGTLPIRGVYLSVLELTKAHVRGWEAPASLPEALQRGAADFVAGAVASCVTQRLVVPVDVVSQRLMVQGTQPGGVVYRNGLQAARGILATEGVRGLYRGAGASLAIFVPSSGLWWGAYGAYQRVLWSLLESSRGPPSAADVVPVQTAAAVCAGATSGLLTTPLDVVKTRLQTAPFVPGQPAPTFRAIAANLLATEGAAGFFRGVGPRITSTMVRARMRAAWVWKPAGRSCAAAH
jgi:solute carrier family 25 protein 44